MDNMKKILLFALIVLSNDSFADERYSFSIIDCIENANYFKISSSYIHNPRKEGELESMKNNDRFIFDLNHSSFCNVNNENYKITIKRTDSSATGVCGADQNAKLSLQSQNENIVDSIDFDLHCSITESLSLDSITYQPDGAFEMCGNTNADQRHKGMAFCIYLHHEELSEIGLPITTKNLKSYIYEHHKIPTK